MTDEIMGNRLQLGVQEGSPQVIYAAGELDYRNCEDLHELIAHAISANGPVVKLALAGLDFVDSSGLRVLIVSALEAREAGGSINIASMSPQLSRMLDISGFGQLFDITPQRQKEEPVEQFPAADRRPQAFEVNAVIESCREARDRVCNYAASYGFSGPALDDIKLAVGEAVSNAVRHGCHKGGAIRVRCRVEDERLLISLKYPSAAFSPCDVPIPTVESGCKGGMGIYFMKLVMDSTSYLFDDGYAVLTLEKRIGL